MLKSERNARIHALATVLVLAAGLVLNLSPIEWALIAFSVAAVWSAEAFNTAIESLCDLVEPEFHPQIGHIKDIAAGAVLLAALAAGSVGIIIFGPKVLAVLGA